MLTNNSGSTGYGYVLAYRCDGTRIVIKSTPVAAYDRPMNRYYVTHSTTTRKEPCTSQVLSKRARAMRWTFTRDGQMYCPSCTPTFNPPHTCPPPPEPPPPPRPLGQRDALGYTGIVLVTYWHTSERRVRTWRTPKARTEFIAQGVLINKRSNVTLAESVHVIPWHNVIRIERESPE